MVEKFHKRCQPYSSQNVRPLTESALASSDPLGEFWDNCPDTAAARASTVTQGSLEPTLLGCAAHCGQELSDDLVMKAVLVEAAVLLSGTRSGDFVQDFY